MITTDIEGHIVYVNKAGEALIGKPAADALGKTLLEVIDLDGRGRAQDRSVIRCGNASSTGGRVHLGRRGMVVSGNGEGERSIELTVSPMRDASRRPERTRDRRCAT